MFTDTNALQKLSSQLKKTDKTLWGKIKSFFGEWIAKLKKAYAGMSPDSELAKIARDALKNAENLQQLWVDAAVEAAQNYRQAPEGQKNNTAGGDVLYSVREIVGDSGKTYGTGVYLDSNLLTGLTDSERIKMVKEYVKELGGSELDAYDQNGNPVKILIAGNNKRFRNRNGKSVRVTKDLTDKNSKKTTKQEAIALVDELITASSLDSKKPAAYPHGWVDNYGTNDWEYWTTYIQDKENTVWNATLNIATSKNGEKILYDIDPIKMVEQAIKLATSTTKSTVTHPDDSVKLKSTRDSDGNSLSSKRTADDRMYEIAAEVGEKIEGQKNNTAGGDVLYSDRFEEDKYFSRQIDRIATLKDGSYIKVGEIKEGSPIELVGIPAGWLYFDVSKIRQEMESRQDPIPASIMKKIPGVLGKPMLITEYFDKNGTSSINVYGEAYVGTSPVVVGIVIGKHRNGHSVDKIQTVHPNRNFLKEATDDRTLHLGENKKETNAWFQALGAKNPPLGGTKYGFIGMLSQNAGFVNLKSTRDSDGNSLSKAQQEYFKDSKVRDEDGNLRVVYHGTDADFTVFDPTKSRANMDIQGMFFSPWDMDAGGYGGNVKAYYLDIKNPASESMGYKALNLYKGQNEAGM